MPLQATSGAASYDAFGGGVAAVPKYIEDYFSTFLFTGSSPSSQSINNGIDLSTKGGLVWVKDRVVANFHSLFDTNRGAGYYLSSSQTSAQALGATTLTSFNTNGFSLGGSTLTNDANPYVSWSWAKAPKFFDVVTYTGNGTAGRTVAHNLGSVPGCIIVKQTSSANTWRVYHRSLGNTKGLALNETSAETTNSAYWNSTTPTSTEFTLGTNSATNENGKTFVAYLFAHNAGGFGLTGTDNVISCGSFTASSGAATVTLGYEPQWIMFKRTDSSTGGNWYMVDVMRGWSFSAVAELSANTSNAEDPNAFVANPTATGFSFGTGTLTASGTYIYIAIRRPMKVPTSSTSVFRPMVIPINSASATTPINAGLTTDMVFGSHNSDESGSKWFASRLTANYRLNSTSTAAEALGEYYWDNMDGVRQQETNAQPTWYFLKRAPSFFDEVCYLGNGSTQTITHNLGVVPELIIGKNRTTAGNNWPVLFNFASTTMNYGFLNLTNSCPNDTYANVGVFSAAPTSTSMFLVNSGSMNTNTNQHVAYLFATCAGVSKVGSYTGNGSSQTINCGFTGGARFVLIKKTSGTGDWMVSDSARGIVSGSDPYLELNNTNAEVTGEDWLDTDSTGFVVNEVSGSNANTNGATYIFLAIA